MTPASNMPLSNFGEIDMTTPHGHPSLSSIPTSESLVSDFSMTDLNDIHSHLWMAGSYGNISPLHHQRVLLRAIIPSELSRLHLVWFDRVIYIKPLPDCLLDTSRYPDYNFDPSGSVAGFLRSYCSLIRSRVDLAVAHRSDLVSKDVTWERWSSFRDRILNKTYDCHINRRYHYGELRLNRLDIIYRVTGRGLTYFTVHRNYKTYFAQYISLFATVFAFVAVILAAMQVLVGIRDIPETLLTTSYRFSVAVLVGVCACFGYVLFVYLFMFLYNIVLARFAHLEVKALDS